MAKLSVINMKAEDSAGNIITSLNNADNKLNSN